MIICFQTQGTVLLFTSLNSFDHNIVAYQSPENVGLVFAGLFLAVYCMR